MIQPKISTYAHVAYKHIMFNIILQNSVTFETVGDPVCYELITDNYHQDLYIHNSVLQRRPSSAP